MPLLCLNIKISTVTCPGVWLCSRGEVILQVQTLHQIKKTKRAYPKFPIPFVETLSFQKIVVGGVESISNLLDNEELQIELIQWIRIDSKSGIVLAKFNQHLGNVLDSFTIGSTGVSVSFKTELLMRKTEFFPGIISPKINATFELEIESYKNMETVYSSMSPESGCETHTSRQRKVCHSHVGYPHCTICSIYDSYGSCPKLDAGKSLHNVFDYSNGRLNYLCCSWRDYVKPVRKCCCCCKCHRLFY